MTTTYNIRGNVTNPVLDVLEDSRMDMNVHTDDYEGTAEALFKSSNEDYHEVLCDLADHPMDNEIWSNLYERCSIVLRAFSILCTKNPDKRELRTAERNVFLESRAYDLLLLQEQMTQQYEQFKDTSVLGKLIAEDDEFLMLFVLLHWSQSGAQLEERGFADLASQYHSMRDVKCIRGQTLRHLKAGTRSGGIGMDCDALCHAADKDDFEKLDRVIFSLLRCGKIDEAIDLVRSVGEPAIAAQLKMYFFVTDPNQTPLDHLDPRYSVSRKRKILIETTKKLISQTAIPAFARMTMAAIAGLSEPLLSMATTTADRIWVMANAAVHNKLLFACTGEVLEDVPLTVSAIFGEIVTAEKSPFFPLYGRMLSGDWESLVEWVCGYLEEQEKQGRRSNDHLLRFIGTIVSVARLKQYDVDIEKSHKIISCYIHLLAQYKLYHLIPFYASLMYRPDAELVLIDLMLEISSNEDRLAYLAALRVAGFDQNSLSIVIVEKMHETQSLSPRDCIDRLRWLFLNGEGTVAAAIKHTNNLIRNFLLHIDEDDSVRELLAEVHEYHVFENMEHLMRSDPELNDRDALISELEELKCHQLFLECHDTCSKFAQAAIQMRGFKDVHEQIFKEDQISSQWQQMDMNLKRNNERAVEHTQRENELRKRKSTTQILQQKSIEACENLLRHPGWRNVPEEFDDSRFEQLRKLRDEWYTNILQMVMDGSNCIQDEQSICHLAILLAEKRINIEKYISLDKRRCLLQKLHQYMKSNVM